MRAALLCLALAACNAEPAPQALPAGELPPAPNLIVPQTITIGAPFRVTAPDAPPRTRVVLAASTSTSGAGTCPPGLGLCLDLDNAVIVGDDRSDATGEATFRVTVPGTFAPGTAVYFQAVHLGGAPEVSAVAGPRFLNAAACPQILRDFAQETQRVRACTRPADCGQILQGTSCGCTRDWVANQNANPARFYQLLADATQDCSLALVSTCDCPQTYGFDCVNQICQWDYTP